MGPVDAARQVLFEARETRVRPGLDDKVAAQLVDVVVRLRELELKKAPSIAETLDWARTLLHLSITTLDQDTLKRTMPVLLKYQTDISKAVKELDAFKKSAKIVGDVMGSFHPHGDQAIYDAMVRMAQEFSMRYRLVDGQGNFGSVDGDNPAAMRYTEARLKKIAEDMLGDITKDTVDFQLNFDDSLKEPVVLPAKIPALLLNGASGIAVGMATNMAPHNLGEVIDGIVAYIANRDISIEELMQYIIAPDFPTGGIIYGYNGVKSAFETGRGIPWV